MQPNVNNNVEKNSNVDVPYYTRDLSKEGKYELTRRVIKANNVLTYRRIISTMNFNKEYFQTKNFNKTEVNASKILK